MSDSKPKVMMLDDERFLLYIYQTAFEKEGYDVATFSDVDEALKALRAGYKPDVILSDITMPGIRSGYQFLESLQQEKLGKHSLKVALTNESQDGAKQRIAELGADAHLIKAQYIPAEIVTKVSELLSNK